MWAFITLVAAVFLGSLVSTAVTDQPDRMGAVIHGALVWVLLSLFSVWMIASGVSLGVSGLFSAMSGLASSATTAVAAGGGDLVQTLGLKDANQVMQKLDDPTTASTLAAATGISNEDATAALADLRARVEWFGTIRRVWRPKSVTSWRSMLSGPNSRRWPPRPRPSVPRKWVPGSPWAPWS